MNKKKKRQELEVSTSTEVAEFTEKFEEFSLMACLAGIGFLGCTGNSCMVLGQWGLSAHDEDELCIPQFFRDRLRKLCGVWGEHQTCSSCGGSWKCLIPTGVKRVTGASRGIICSQIIGELDLCVVF
jgi:hypothetical protein